MRRPRARRNPVVEQAVGLLVNPKLKTPVLATYEGNDMTIFRDEGGWRFEGAGYYDEDEPLAAQSGFLRTHTPRGVVSKGMGYGTCLYTALCLGGHHNSDDNIDISTYLKGDGVMSIPYNRSEKAEYWWRRARDMGLVTPDYVEASRENVDATEELGGAVMGETVELDDLTAEVTYVNNIDVDINASLDVDVYPYDRAGRAELILASFIAPVAMTFVEEEGRRRHKLISDTDLRGMWRSLKEDDAGTLIDEVESDLIMALDVRALSLQTVNLLGILLQYDDVPEKELHEFRMRWELGLDPEEPIRQMELPLKPNSAEMRRAVAAVERASYLRSQTDWSRFAALP